MYTCKNVLSNLNPFLDVQLTEAGKWLFHNAYMNSNSLQYDLFHEPSRIAIGEGFYTTLTQTRLLYSVTSFMSVMTTEVNEGFSKIFTCSRRFSCVNPFMTAQVTGTRKHLFTLLKWIRLQCELFS